MIGQTNFMFIEERLINQPFPNSSLLGNKNGLEFFTFKNLSWCNIKTVKFTL